MPQTPTQTEYEAVIGLEIHVQLRTQSKLFCPDSTRFGDEPNVNTCPVCLGYPGALPVLNKKAVEYAVMLGLALNCEIAELSKFDRKHYFYPDLPKAYQISQYNMPVCTNGYMELSTGTRVRINRAHMEEDAGKLVHAGAEGLAGSDYSLVDLNRAGTPLLEIVSEPDIKSAAEAREYMTNMRNIVRYLGVCDGNMEEGSMRCDVNISVRPKGQTEFGTKTEIKNMNSTRAIEQAAEYEIARQVQILESGGSITQASRLWNEATSETMLMRVKEGEADYRYFPEPDLRPLHISREWIEALKRQLPELPEERRARYISELDFSTHDASILVDVKELGDFFDAARPHCPHYKTLVNWLTGEITAYLKTEKKSMADTRLTPNALAELVELQENNTISSTTAKKLLAELLEKGGSPAKIVEERDMAQISDVGELKKMVEDVIANNPKQAQQFRDGKEQVLGFFVGQIMRATQGSANPELVNQLLRELI